MLAGTYGFKRVPEINIGSHVEVPSRKRVRQVQCGRYSCAQRERRKAPKGILGLLGGNVDQVVAADGRKLHVHRVLVEIRVTVAVVRYELLAAAAAARQPAAAKGYKRCCRLFIRKIKIQAISSLYNPQELLEQVLLLQQELLQE